MKRQMLEGFIPNRDRGGFDEREFAKTLEYFGNPVLPERYEAFLRANHETHTTMPIGYEARGYPHVLGPGDIRHWSDGHFWGREFMPFMANNHAFVAFDLRPSNELVEPPIVFLDWDLEDDDAIHYDRVEKLADDLNGFLDLLGLWRAPEGLPNYEYGSLSLFDDLGVQRVGLVHKLGVIGWILRSGQFREGLRVGRSMGAVKECSVDREFEEEFSVSQVWERIRPIAGDRVIPFMTGADGWLALDYRAVDSEPPVVFVPRHMNQPAGEPKKVASSVIEAYEQFR